MRDARAPARTPMRNERIRFAAKGVVGDLGDG